tara:strand:- start:994 stop:2985 length:1992 start_codon:yes stop_codon:yes gene_type:complete
MNKITRFKNINLFRFSVVFVLIYPTQGLGLISGIPFYNINRLVYFLIFIFIIFNIKQLTTLNLLFLIFFLLFKVYFIFNSLNIWNVCVEDTTTPVQSNFTFEYYELDCMKSFDSLNDEYTFKTNNVNFRVVNDKYEWMGANSSNFPVGFINHSAYNFYDLRRDWLPFNLSAQKNLHEEAKYLKIIYLGYVNISFNDQYEIKLPSSYSNVTEKVLTIPKNTSEITVNYFFKDLNVKKDLTHPSTVPNDFTEGLKYAHLQIVELDEKSDEIKLNRFFNIDIIFIIVFFLINISTINSFFKDKQFIFLLMISGILINQNFGFSIDFKYLGYLLLFALFVLSKNKKHVIIVLTLLLLSLNSFLINEPWNILDFNIKPSGTDILTYENQARLILEGDGLRGGADVFWYSPGYRYFLFLIHVVFGDSWGVAWKFILSCSILLIGNLNKKLKITSVMVAFFLVFTNVQNLYLFGMSETVSILFLLLSLNTSENKYLPPLFISFATLIRPEILLVSVLILFITRNRIRLWLFFIPMLFPLLHNLYFGNSFVPLSTAATYSRNINFDIFRNIDYLIFNPFSSKINQILGLIPTLVAFLVILFAFCICIKNYSKNKKLNNFLPLLLWFLAVIPYFIYDPTLFYPRHVLIALLLVSLDYEFLFSNSKETKVSKY